MNQGELKQFKHTVLSTFKKMKADGREFTTYKCPHCLKKIDTLKPSEDAVGNKGYWDSAKGCYECGKPAFVKTWPNGTTEVINLN